MKLFDPAEGLQMLSSGLRCILNDLVDTPSAAPTASAPAGSTTREELDDSVLEDEMSSTPSELSSAALNVFVQVNLCLRHAHRVLQVLNSSLSRTLTCTVYVNSSALQALGSALAASSIAGSSPTDGKKVDLIDEQQLVTFVRKMLWQMDRADCAAELKKTRKEQDEQDSEGEYDEDQNEEEEADQQVN